MNQVLRPTRDVPSMLISVDGIYFAGDLLLALVRPVGRRFALTENWLIEGERSGEKRSRSVHRLSSLAFSR